MKISFNKSLSELTSRINAPSRSPISQSANFKELLKDISPFHSEMLKNKGELTVDDPMRKTQLSPLASYMPSKEQLIKPESVRLSSSEDNQPEGVKTPTLVRAERRRMPSAYDGLSNDARASEVQKLTSAFGFKYGIDPDLATAVAEVESAFNPMAISKDGHESKGLFQLLDSTGKDLLARTELSTPYEPFDPEQNAELGVSYLRYLHDVFNKEVDLSKTRATLPAEDSDSLEKLAVAAFNAGEGRVAQAQRKARDAGMNPGNYSHVERYLPEITQSYVLKVDAARARYNGDDWALEGS
jgi:hypothetical protein